MRSSADQKQWLIARGNSMRPFFRSGDLVVFVPCPVEDVRKGDVIIFIPPGQKERVVHRVISTGPEGVRTRGDANPCRDTGELRQQDIVGRAVSVERNRMVLPVASGLAGHMLAAFIRALRMSDHMASYVLHPCYRGLARSGLFRALLPTALRPRVVIFERGGTREMQLVLGKRVIGRRPAGAGARAIQRPFRIFVDERVLP